MNDTNRISRARFSRLLLCSLAFSWLAACGGEGSSASPDQESIGLRGAMQFKLVPEAPLVQGENDLRLTLRDAETGAVVEGALIEVTAIMPAMGHEATFAPAIEEAGDGAYAVRGLALSMPGRWDVHVRVEHQGTIDEVHFFYDVP
ncbi:FixH family protein [Polyangium sorediatum]|uniref:FixH family protein n=1 Tax=Polyangium sorediatum TaxID=889274 RepID=A0ABT6NTQ7_9BACT|nr:FixH family protein [Polyangium sorediatum]MDI1431692.1 FixH family protein [Polyangium sorediatum]